jgi:flagellar hook-associated protein 2
MATSSVSNSNATNFIMALGTGSGVDIKALAQSLVDAEQMPKQDIIQKRIDKAQARINGYNTVQYAIEQVKAALDALKDSSAFNTISAASSVPGAVSVTVNGTGAPSNREVVVNSLAQAKRVVSTLRMEATDPLSNASYPVTIEVGTGSAKTSTSFTVTDLTPSGLVKAINNANFRGVTASLIETGDSNDPLRIVVQGAPGAANTFSITAAALAAKNTGLLSSDATQSANNRSALDASLSVDGITVSRGSNRISDLIPGVTLDLLRETDADTQPVVNIALARDVAPVKEKIKALVSNYNDLQAILDAAENPDSSVEKLGGSLAGDPTARSVRDQVRKILLPDVTSLDNSSTATLTDRQLGLFIDQDRRMKFVNISESGSSFATTYQVGNESALDKALANRFEDVVVLFSGSGGIGKRMSDQLAGTGAYVDTSARPSSPMRILKVQASNAGSRIREDQDRLLALEDRMKGLLERYMEQFAVMDSLVGQSKALRTSVENSFKGMSNSRN